LEGFAVDVQCYKKDANFVVILDILLVGSAGSLHWGTVDVSTTSRMDRTESLRFTRLRSYDY
jgi:hypothetical protein